MDLPVASTQTVPTIRHLRVQPMQKDQILLAMPLAQSLWPDLTLCEWSRYCEALIANESSDSGIECAAGEDGYLFGVFGYSTKELPRDGKTLCVEPFLAVDLYGRDFYAARMLSHIDGLATELGCSRIQLSLQGFTGVFPILESARFDLIEGHGFEANGVNFCKPCTS